VTSNLDAVAEPAKAAVPEAGEGSAAPGEQEAAGAAEGLPAGGQEGDPVSPVSAAVQDLADSARRYHDRAEQREGVIDYLRSELELLRRGERRGLLRPLLTDLCRLRNDLLRQAGGLPVDYDAEKAAGLLLSYAESVELTLEGNGVVTYTPDEGDAFDPRRHRKISGTETADPELGGRIAGVQRAGYMDIEANSPVTLAEVTVYTVIKGEQ
jgi:molecular chaperone GrpE (heat shock protein)